MATGYPGDDVHLIDMHEPMATSAQPNHFQRLGIIQMMSMQRAFRAYLARFAGQWHSDKPFFESTPYGTPSAYLLRMSARSWAGQFSGPLLNEDLLVYRKSTAPTLEPQADGAWAYTQTFREPSLLTTAPPYNAGNPLPFLAVNHLVCHHCLVNVTYRLLQDAQFAVNKFFLRKEQIRWKIQKIGKIELAVWGYGYPRRCSSA